MPTPRALLVDFGGVLTSSVLDAYSDFCLDAGLPPDTVLQCFSRDPVGRRLLVDVEEGRLDEFAFESALADLLSVRTGVAVSQEGLLDRLHARLRPEPTVLAAVRAIRETGVTAVLLSNSLGEEAYRGYDLESRFDHVVLSARVGVRKPSRRIFALAAQTAKVAPEACLMVDDLDQNILGARRAGMAGLLHTDASRTVAALEDTFELGRAKVS